MPARLELQLKIVTLLLAVSATVLGAGFAVTPALADGILTPMGPVAAEQRQHMINITGITMIAILPVLIGVPLMFWRYRRGGKGKYTPNFGFSWPLEIMMWGVPIILVMIMANWLWHSVERLDPYRPLGNNPLKVQVVGLDWKWLFIYPEQNVASVGTLAVPVGRPVELELTTDTVMQSFLVPELAGQIYAMPGMQTTLNFMATKPGIAIGSNSQFNGVGFADQVVKVDAMSQAEWETWMAEAGKGPTLDRQSYARLAISGTLDDARKTFNIAEGPVRLSLGDPQLFKFVLSRYHKGTPVPPEEQPGTATYNEKYAGANQ